MKLVFLFVFLFAWQVFAEPYSVRPRIENAKPLEKLPERLSNQAYWEKELLKVNRGLIAFIAELVTLHAGQRKIVMGRDLEPLYDLVRALIIEMGESDPELELFRLINVGRLSRKDAHLGEYLAEEGITAESIEKTPIWLVDTGYSGTFTKELRVRFKAQAQNINLRVLGSNYDDQFPSARVFLEQLDPKARDYNSNRKEEWYQIFVNTLERMPKYLDRSTTFQQVKGKWEAISALSDRVERARFEEVIGYLRHYVRTEGLQRFKEIRENMLIVATELEKKPGDFLATKVRKAIRKLGELEAFGFVTDIERLERNGFLRDDPDRLTLAKFLMVVKEEYGDKGPYSPSVLTERATSLAFDQELGGLVAKVATADSQFNFQIHARELTAKLEEPAIKNDLSAGKISILKEIILSSFAGATWASGSSWFLFDFYTSLFPHFSEEENLHEFVKDLLGYYEIIPSTLVDFMATRLQHLSESPQRDAKEVLVEYFKTSQQDLLSRQGQEDWHRVFLKLWKGSASLDKDSQLKSTVRALINDSDEELAIVVAHLAGSTERTWLVENTEKIIKELNHPSFLKFVKRVVSHSPSIVTNYNKSESYWGFIIGEWITRSEGKKITDIDKEVAFCFAGLKPDEGMRFFRDLLRRIPRSSSLGHSLMRYISSPEAQPLKEAASALFKSETQDPAVLLLAILDQRPEARVKVIPILSLSAQRRVSNEDTLKQTIELINSQLGVSNLTGALLRATRGTKVSVNSVEPSSEPIALTEKQIIKIVNHWPSPKERSPYEDFLNMVQAHDPSLVKEILVTSLQSRFLRLEALAFLQAAHKSNPSLLEKLKVEEPKDPFPEAFSDAAKQYSNVVDPDLIRVLSSEYRELLKEGKSLPLKNAGAYSAERLKAFQKGIATGTIKIPEDKSTILHVQLGQVLKHYIIHYSFENPDDPVIKKPDVDELMSTWLSLIPPEGKNAEVYSLFADIYKEIFLKNSKYWHTSQSSLVKWFGMATTDLSQKEKTLLASTGYRQSLINAPRGDAQNPVSTLRLALEVSTPENLSDIVSKDYCAKTNSYSQVEGAARKLPDGDWKNHVLDAIATGIWNHYLSKRDSDHKSETLKEVKRIATLQWLENNYGIRELEKVCSRSMERYCHRCGRYH